MTITEATDNLATYTAVRARRMGRTLAQIDLAFVRDVQTEFAPLAAKANCAKALRLVQKRGL